MKFVGVELRGLVTNVNDEPAPSDVMDEITEKLMDELLNATEAVDPEVDATLAKAEMRIRLLVEVADSVQAIHKAQEIIDRAMLAIGMLPSWEVRRPEPPAVMDWDFEDSDWRLKRRTDDRLITA